MDHFSVGGASWQKNCDRLEKATAVVEWVERTVPPDVSLVHDWAMSAVRFLGGSNTAASRAPRATAPDGRRPG